MDTLLNSLIEVVKEASLIMTSDYEIIIKGGLPNIATSNDIAVQKFLFLKLKEILPGSGFLCEEENSSHIKNDTWIIDPIDGTTNYSRGLDSCAISVALMHEADIILGVVYLPYKNELFTAIRGKGAYLNGERIKVSNRPFEDSLLCASLCAYHKEHLDFCLHVIKNAFIQCNDIRRFGSAAMELCYLAVGRCELFFEYELYPWDYAAASLILKEAGGCVSSFGGERLGYCRQTGVLAANNIRNLRRLHEIVRINNKI